jgi:Holliday junction DNA helicase RuvA
VGYRVLAPLSTFYRLPEADGEVELLIHAHMSDSALALYGFATEEEKEIFGLLLGVSGVGPKLALNVLSGIEAAELIRALAGGDQNRLCAVPGIGKKTAQRLIVELKDKAAGLGWAYPAAQGPTLAQVPPLVADASSALVNLGYQPAQAEAAVQSAQASLGGEPPLAALLREALRLLSR